MIVAVRLIWPHQLLDEIDQAEICIVPKLKHLGLIEQPQSFTLPVIEFFRKLPL